MNWLIDRLLVASVVLVLIGTLAGLSAAGFRQAGELCAVSAFIASVVMVWVRHFQDD